MRITVNLDEQALRDAQEASPGRSLSELVNEALREYSRRLARFADLRGSFRWTGDLDALRLREPPTPESD